MSPLHFRAAVFHWDGGVDWSRVGGSLWDPGGLQARRKARGNMARGRRIRRRESKSRPLESMMLFLHVPDWNRESLLFLKA